MNSCLYCNSSLVEVRDHLYSYVCVSKIEWAIKKFVCSRCCEIMFLEIKEIKDKLVSQFYKTGQYKFCG